MQGVILAGGLGTRLRPLTSSVPKPMVTVHGRPFLEYELTLMAQSGITDVVLCVGYLGEQILQYFGSGGGLGIQIRYSWDGEHLRGPIGALKNAESLLEDSFFVLYGDAYLRLDYQALMGSMLHSNRLGAMAVLHNCHEYGPSDLLVADGMVKEYDKKRRGPELEWVNFGVSALRRQALQIAEAYQLCDEETFYGQLIAQRQLIAFEVTDRFYEIGSPSGLEQFRNFIGPSASSRRLQVKGGIEMTQIFLDTANTDEIRGFLAQGIGEGVTTNQKIILSEGSIDLKERIVEICALKPEWPVSVETTTKTTDALVAEAQEYAAWHPNVVIKLAMDKDGVALKVAKELQEMGIRTNLTAMVTINQLYLAAQAGATYVSFFYNRARDCGIDPVATIKNVVPLLERDTRSRLICGSIRKPGDVEEILCAGAHIVTIPTKILTQMPFHPKTEETIREFDQAWLEFTRKATPLPRRAPSLSSRTR